MGASWVRFAKKPLNYSNRIYLMLNLRFQVLKLWGIKFFSGSKISGPGLPARCRALDLTLTNISLLKIFQLKIGALLYLSQ